VFTLTSQPLVQLYSTACSGLQRLTTDGEHEVDEYQLSWYIRRERKAPAGCSPLRPVHGAFPWLEELFALCG
jgi:hypothetical protein